MIGGLDGGGGGGVLMSHVAFKTALCHPVKFKKCSRRPVEFKICPCPMSLSSDLMSHVTKA